MPGHLRFRRRVRIAPGISLNLSRSGVSTSFGARGLHYTVGHGRRRVTAGIPGTGLSYSAYSPTHARHAVSPSLGAAPDQPARSVAAGAAPSLGAMLPAQKIAVGVVLTLMVITAPIGITLLVIGLVQLRQPQWRVRTLVNRARRRPQDAFDLLQRAHAIAPHNPEVLGPLAEWHYLRADDGAALPLYREYLDVVPGDLVARAHFGNCCLRSDLVDEAISAFEAVRAAEKVQFKPATRNGQPTDSTAVLHVVFQLA